MNEGKELLFKILNDKIQELSNINIASLTYDEINLVELSSSLKKDYNNINKASNNLIRDVLSDTEYASIIPAVIRIKDLYIGKRDYNINLKLSNDYKLTLDTFIYVLEEKLENKYKNITKKDDIIAKCHSIVYKINNNEIIDDIEFIKELINEYDNTSKSKNLVSIMVFITRHNLELLNNIAVIPEGTINKLEIVTPKIDDRLLDILNTLDISVNTLPNYFIKELKQCDVNNVISVYELIKKNKVEKYGILHLITKDNYLSKLILLLYSDPKTIQCVVDELVDIPNRESINVLRNVVNLVTSIFISHPNDYFKSKYQNFKKVIKILKDLKVNYKELISRFPMFLITDYEILDEMLNMFEENGFNKKLIINRCYKTLSTNPGLMTINLNILLKNGVDTKEYAIYDESKYILLKCNNLQKKLDYFIARGSININHIDYNKLGKLILVNKFDLETNFVN